MENQHKNIANASANEIEMIACFVKQQVDGINWKAECIDYLCSQLLLQHSYVEILQLFLFFFV
jgi:hypothetical protein